MRFTMFEEPRLKKQRILRVEERGRRAARLSIGVDREPMPNRSWG